MPVLTLAVLTPLVIAFLVVSFREPIRVALPLYAALLPFGSGLSIGPSAFGSVSSLLGITLGMALLTQLVTLRRSVGRIPASVPVWLGFLGLAGASVFWSVSPQVTASSFPILASLILLYLLLVLVGIDRAELVRTELALVVGGVLAAGYGLAQLLILGGLPTGEGASPRFGEGLLGPDNEAAALLLPLAIALAHSVAQEGGRRWAFAGAAAVLLAGIVLTGSRGGLLAAVVVMLTLIAVIRRGRRRLLGYVAAGLLLLGVLLVANPGGVGQRQVNAGADSSGRSEIWTVGLSACKTYCLTGSGWGTFPQVYAAEQAEALSARVLPKGTNFEPHSIWLLAGVEAGLGGLLLVVTGLGLSLGTALRLPAHLRGPPLAGLLGTITAGIFLSDLEFKFFWMVLAYVAMAHQVAQIESMAVRNSRVREFEAQTSAAP